MKNKVLAVLAGLTLVLAISATAAIASGSTDSGNSFNCAAEDEVVVVDGTCRHIDELTTTPAVCAEYVALAERNDQLLRDSSVFLVDASLQAMEFNFDAATLLTEDAIDTLDEANALESDMDAAKAGCLGSGV